SAANNSISSLSSQFGSATQCGWTPSCDAPAAIESGSKQETLGSKLCNKPVATSHETWFAIGASGGRNRFLLNPSAFICVYLRFNCPDLIAERGPVVAPLQATAARSALHPPDPIAAA